MIPYMCISMQRDFKTAILSFYVDSETRDTRFIEKTPVPKYEVKLTSDGVLIYMIGTKLKDAVYLPLTEINVNASPACIAVDDLFVLPNKIPSVLETFIKDVYVSFIDFDVYRTPNWLLSLFYELNDYLTQGLDDTQMDRILNSVNNGYMPVKVGE